MTMTSNVNWRWLPGAFTRRNLGVYLLALAVAALILPEELLAGQDRPTAALPNSPAPVIFAAASMEAALDAIAAKWNAETNKTVKISYGSSATLAKQIEQGAPADIFVSADLKWMDYLEKKKLIRSATRQNLLGNKLVLIEPSNADVALEITKGVDHAGAVGDGKIEVCAIDSCPAGIYAKEALESLGRRRRA
jgi:molybdate transport system substrate-binding protein